MPVPFIADGLRKLADLRDRGVLSAAEFDQEKARLLDRSTAAPEASREGHPSRRARWLASAVVVFLVLLAGIGLPLIKRNRTHRQMRERSGAGRVSRRSFPP